MNIEVWFINRKSPDEKKKIVLDLPTVPRKGECIIIGDAENYEVEEVVYRIDEDYRFSGRVTVDAVSLWNKE